MNEQDKLNLVTNYFAEDWAIEKAMQLLEDYESSIHSALEDAARESEYRRGYRHGYEQRDAEVRGALA